LPHVGGLEDAQVETVVALRPDLVLAATSTRSVARLEALGLPVLAIEPRSLADLQRTIARLEQALATGQGAALQARLDKDLAEASRLLPPAARGQRVYFEVSEAPYAASEASFIGELLARLGAANVVPASLGPFPKLNPEFVVRADPQVIMTTAGPAAGISERPGWRRIEALRTGRVCAFAAREADLMVRPGPRLGEGLRLMARCLGAAAPSSNTGAAGTATGARTGGPSAAAPPAPMAAPGQTSSPATRSAP
jgi:iron complex transport system substrate-binding protein